MKLLRNKFYFLIIFLYGMMSAFAGTAPASGPPAPTAKKPPPPPGLPIDDYIYILILIALVYGLYVVNKSIVKAKPSI